jgi:hypothetical protein
VNIVAAEVLRAVQHWLRQPRRVLLHLRSEAFLFDRNYGSLCRLRYSPRDIGSVVNDEQVLTRRVLHRAWVKGSESLLAELN